MFVNLPQIQGAAEEMLLTCFPHSRTPRETEWTKLGALGLTSLQVQMCKLVQISEWSRHMVMILMLCLCWDERSETVPCRCLETNNTQLTQTYYTLIKRRRVSALYTLQNFRPSPFLILRHSIFNHFHMQYGFELKIQKKFETAQSVTLHCDSKYYKTCCVTLQGIMIGPLKFQQHSENILLSS